MRRRIHVCEEPMTVMSVFLVCSECVPNVFLMCVCLTRLVDEPMTVMSVFLVCSECVPNVYVSHEIGGGTNDRDDAAE
jgi:hypothetical protein